MLKRKKFVYLLFAFLFIISLFTTISVLSKDQGNSITAMAVVEQQTPVKYYLIEEKDSWLRNSVEKIGLDVLLYKEPSTGALYAVTDQGDIVGVSAVLREDQLKQN